MTILYCLAALSILLTLLFLIRAARAARRAKRVTLTVLARTHFGVERMRGESDASLRARCADVLRLPRGDALPAWMKSSSK
jgi:hypothetical protein